MFHNLKSFDTHEEAITNTGLLAPNIVKRLNDKEQQDIINEWEWNKMTKLDKKVAIYKNLTTFIMIYSLFKNLFTSSIQDFILPAFGITLDEPLHCYLIGRFYTHWSPKINNVVEVLITFFNLAWRLAYTFRVLQISTHSFLLIPKQDLEQYQRLIIGKSKRAEKILGSPKNNRMSKIFIRQVICHKLPKPSCGPEVYALRPNRTRDAHLHLRKTMTATTAVATSLILFWAITWCYYWLFHYMLDDGTYIANYSTCDVELERQHKIRQAIGSTFHLTWHRALSLIADFVENFILWTETGFAIFYGIGFSFVINYDLVRYWRYIHCRTLKLSQQLRQKFHNELKARSLICYNTSDMIGSKRKSRLEIDNQIDESLRSLMFEIEDFIQEIRRANVYISDVLSLSVSIWVAILLAYIWLLPYKENDSEHYEDILSVGYFISTTALCLVGCLFLAVLTLHRYCMRTYPILCTLAAHYQTGNKSLMLIILDYFTNRHTCYYLFWLRPFLPTTCLSLIGWSFSCFFILRGLIMNATINDIRTKLIE